MILLTILLVTYVKLCLRALNATFLAGTAAVDLDVPKGLTLHTNDLRGQVCGRFLTLRLPHASVKALITLDTSRKSWSEAAAMEFDIALELFTCPKTSHNPQSTFLHEQDILTQRAQYLLNQLTEAQVSYDGRSHASRRSGRRHRRGLYLPPLILPRFSRVQNTNVQQQKQHPSSRPRQSRLPQMSESDGEDVSEADRDARLARSRIVRPFPTSNVDDSEPSFSDDESDDADLTDGGSSDSEWSAGPGKYKTIH